VIEVDGPPVVDRARLAMLEALIGQDRYSKALLRFHDDVADRLPALDAVSTPVEQIAQFTHKLTSTAGNLGFQELSVASRRVMQAAQSEDGAKDLIPAMAALQAAAVRAQRALSDLPG
jgi:HPt (histidine-containing phosphotransfer) domain-containing protein